MRQETIAALIAFVQERMGEYPSNYVLENAGNALITELKAETPSPSPTSPGNPAFPTNPANPALTITNVTADANGAIVGTVTDPATNAIVTGPITNITTDTFTSVSTGYIFNRNTGSSVKGTFPARQSPVNPTNPAFPTNPALTITNVTADANGKLVGTVTDPATNAIVTGPITNITTDTATSVSTGYIFNQNTGSSVKGTFKES